MAEIIIPVDVFYAATPNPDKYRSIINTLDAYKCFVTNGGERERGSSEHTGGGELSTSHGARGNVRSGGMRRNGARGHPRGQERMRQERPKIGTRELSREAMCKKDFLSLTNKVSAANKDVIIRKMLAALAPAFSTMYCNVLWEIMQRPVQIYQNIYAELARIVAINTPMPDKLTFKRAWEACYQDVTAGENAFVRVPGDFNDVSDEGVFHEWTIWKKSRINLIKGCVFLCFHGVFTKPPYYIIEPVVNAVDTEMDTQQCPAHILDYWIDIISGSWDAERDIEQPIHPPMIEKLKSWTEKSVRLPPKCRFKIEGLYTTYCCTSTPPT